MSRIARIVLFLFCCIFLADAASAQQASVRRPWWITLGGGLAVANGATLLLVGTTYSKAWDASMISGRILAATNDNPTIWRIDPSSTTYRLTDYSILYGPAWRGEAGFVSVAAGIGMVKTKVEQGVNHEVNSGISLPIEGQAFWQFADSFGLGLYAFSSLNGIQSFSGAMLSIQMGVMNP